MAGKFTQQHPTSFENVTAQESIKSGQWVNRITGKKPTSATERPVGVAQSDAEPGEVVVLAVEGSVGVQMATGPVNALQVGTTPQYEFNPNGSSVFVEMATGTNVGLTIASTSTTPNSSIVAFIPKGEWAAPVTPSAPQFMEVVIL